MQFHSEQVSQTAAPAKTGSVASAGPGSGVVELRLTRTWRSPVADVAFRDAGHGKVEPATIHGTGGVVVTGESQRGNAAPIPSRLAADELTGEFGPNSSLTSMTGTGHAGIEETTANGSHADRERRPAGGAF